MCDPCDPYREKLNIHKNENDINKINMNKYLNEMKECIERKGYYLSPAEIILADIAYTVNNNGSYVIYDDNISDKEKIKIKDEAFNDVFNLCRVYAMHKNFDLESNENIIREIYSYQDVVPTFEQQIIAHSLAEKIEQETQLKFNIKNTNVARNFVIIKYEKGQCQARYVDDDIRCYNKTEPGKICCSEHEPLTQEARKTIIENRSSTISYSGSTSTESSKSHDHSKCSKSHDHSKCSYISHAGNPCKRDALGKFCKVCHKKHDVEISTHKANNYCTVILTSGINKGRACGEEACAKGFNICPKHCPKEDENKKCDHINKEGGRCTATIKNPLHTKCGKHINSISHVPNYELEPQREKTEAELEWEEMKRKMNEVYYCNAVCVTNGKICGKKASYIIQIDGKHGEKIDKYVCGTHEKTDYKESMKEKTHRCEARTNKGHLCTRMNVPEGFKYCNQHTGFEPIIQCGAFDINTNDRCLKNCEECSDFCKGHGNYTADPIKEQYEIEFIRGQLQAEANRQFWSQYTVVCVDPPKPKLKILTDEEFDRIQKEKASIKKPLKLKIIEDESPKISVNTENYGLDYFVSNSEESDGTEKSEEIIQTKSEPQVKSVRGLKPDEVEMISEITGWTEEQIRIMKNKNIIIRVLDNKKTLNINKTINQAKHNLERHFTKAVRDTNEKYKSCKKSLSNVIRGTFYDLVNSLDNTIELIGTQRFSGRENLIPECKDAIKILRNLEKDHDNKIKGLPVPIIEKQLLSMDITKYMAAFEDVINTVRKEMKEDVKYIQDFQKFMSEPPKRTKSEEQMLIQKTKKREEFNEKYRKYFAKYIVRFAKVALHKENCTGRMFGFANYFIDLLKAKSIDYTRFRNAFGGELKTEDGERVFYCDIFTVISNIINENVDSDIMDYLDVDISTNLSSSEHQTEFSHELRECKRVGHRYGKQMSMLDVGKVERFNASYGGLHGNAPWDWINKPMSKETITQFIRDTPGNSQNYLKIMTEKFDWPAYPLPIDNTPIKKQEYGILNGYMIPLEMSDEDKNLRDPYENYIPEILGITV